MTAQVDIHAQETGCHVYGVVRAKEGRVPDDLAGIDDAPVRMVVHGGVAAVVGEIRLVRPPGRRADLLSYSRVLDTLAASGEVAPVRFGSVLVDEQSVLMELLAPNEEYFTGLLDQLAGRAQFNLGVMYHANVALAEIVAADSEVADLRQRTRDLPEEAAYGERVRLGELVARTMEGKRAADLDALLSAIVPYTASHNVRIRSGVDQVADVTFLVDNDRREEFEKQLGALAETVHERIRLRLIGPVAPYDFVGES